MNYQGHAFLSRYFITFTMVLFLLPLSGRGTVAAENHPLSYTWAVVPQFSGLAVHRDWSPVLELLEERTGVQINLLIYQSIPQFESAFLKGEPDFAYMNPYHVVMAHRAQGYIPMLRDNASELTGILVVRKNSDLNSIDDLQGKSIVFPSPNAFAASLYLRALLTEKEKIQYSQIYAGTHSNAYRHVLLGFTQAGGAVVRTLKREPKAVQDQLKIIYKTPGTPSHSICAHPRVPATVRESIVNAMLDLATQADNKPLLAAILMPVPVNSDYTDDYKGLEQLNIDKYASSAN